MTIYPSNVSTAFNLKLNRLLGDNFIFVMGQSQFDPGSPREAWIACKKHKTHKMIKINDDGFPSDEDLLAAAQSCETCIYEYAAAMPATRWPNAGEDGGAEL